MTTDDKTVFGQPASYDGLLEFETLLDELGDACGKTYFFNVMQRHPPGVEWLPMVRPIREKVIAAARRLAGLAESPVPLLLFCPECNVQHVDAPDERTPGWTNPPHRSHLCHACGHVWRPADIATTGIAALTSKGASDGSPVPAASRNGAIEPGSDRDWCRSDDVPPGSLSSPEPAARGEDWRDWAKWAEQNPGLVYGWAAATWEGPPDVRDHQTSMHMIPLAPCWRVIELERALAAAQPALQPGETSHG